MSDLSQEREAEVRALRAQVHAHIPEMVPFVKDLSDLGMIPGWRCMRRFRLLTDPEWPPEKCSGPLRTGREFIEANTREKP